MCVSGFICVIGSEYVPFDGHSVCGIFQHDAIGCVGSISGPLVRDQDKRLEDNRWID